MDSPSLDTFHGVCRELDHRKTLEALMEECRHRTIADKDHTHEDAVIRNHLAPQHAAWECRVQAPTQEVGYALQHAAYGGAVRRSGGRVSRAVTGR
jgi:hypothetical protein